MTIKINNAVAEQQETAFTKEGPCYIKHVSCSKMMPKFINHCRSIERINQRTVLCVHVQFLVQVGFLSPENSDTTEIST
jgi:hypothetical protein